MINLVSYPRSGNTFFRNVLYEVYGIESGTFLTDGHGPDSDFESFAVVKTHHLPEELPTSLQKRKTVLLLRDGRDCVVSLAHHRKDVVDRESDFDQNLIEAIEAAEGSYFGGWSLHTETWLPKADIVIRFEDLISDPISQVEQLRGIMDLPEPKREKLPSFESQKAGQPQYGSGKEVSDENLAPSWFRRGKVNGWRDELSTSLHERFWHLHGESMHRTGYGFDGEPSSFQCPEGPSDKKRVLIEASKIADVHTDGIKRYVIELLRAAQTWPIHNVEVYALIHDQVLPVADALNMVGSFQSATIKYTRIKNLLRTVLPAGAYNALARAIPVQKIRIKKRRQIAVKQSGEFDIIHLTLPQNYRDIEGYRTKKLIATIHDMTHEIHPEYHTENNVRLSKLGLEYLKANNATYIAVSERTQSDLETRGLRSTVVHEGVDRRRFFKLDNDHWRGLIQERYGVPSVPFFLSVCTLEPRKNLKTLIDAYAALPKEVRAKHPLLLSGQKGWKWKDDIVPDHCKKDVHFTGYVREHHLNALYSMAYAFCYVSHYEGFGLPVLEAMACGVPAIVSNNSSLPEVVGEAGLLVDPSDIHQISEAFLKILESSELRNELSAKAIRRSWEFEWGRCWDKTYAAICT